MPARRSRPSADGFEAGERCHAIVRPEKLEVAGDERPTGDRPRVDGTVESSLYLGTATQLVVRLADGTAMTVLVPNADEAERQRLPGGGARVRLAGSPSTCTWCREQRASDRPRQEIREARARSTI